MRALVIYPGGGVRELDDLSLEALQEVVGGYVEAIGLDGAIGFVDEEGKLRESVPPVNAIATRLLQEAGGRPGDFVVGTFVVTGQSNDDGDPTSIPERWERRIRGLAE
jgi:hypothetical protein